MRRRLGLFVLIAVALCPAPLRAQWWDAQMPRGGELQIGLSGQNMMVEARFTPDGTLRPLSSVLAAELNAAQVPPLDSLDQVLAGLFPTLGLELPDPSRLGDLSYDALLERTRAPISLNFGATDWLAFYTVVPIVKGRSFVGTAFDTLAANAGPSDSVFGGNPDALFQQLNDGIVALEGIVAADTLPVDLQAQAEQLLSDARAYEAGMAALRQQQYVPTESSSSGQALGSFYDGLVSGFETFQISLPDSFPLVNPMLAEQAAALASGLEFGIDPVGDRDTGVKFGDIEVGLSLQPLNTFRRTEGQPRPTFPLRLRIDALYRLATGSPPVASRLTDAGTGDGQPDLELRGTLDVGLGSHFWLSLFAAYNIQFEARIERLVTSRQSPIQLGAYTAVVSWNPGDVLTLLAAPRFNLTRVITFSGLFMVTHHGQDRYGAVDPVDPAAPFQPADLEVGTEWRAMSVGFGARYSTTYWTGDRRSGIPMEVELTYLNRTIGRDGLAPDRSVWQVGLRYYWSIFR